MKTRHQNAPRRTAATAARRWWRGGGMGSLLFLLPLIVIFGVFSWWPIVKSMLMSVQKTNLVTDPSWVGLDNFARVFADPLLVTATWNTVWFTVLAVVIGFPLPILLAVFIGELRRTRGLASALAYVPVIIPPVVSVLLWKQMYDPGEHGLLNTIIAPFGIGPVPWLQTAELAMPSIVVQSVWAAFGTTTIIYLAALMSVPPELYEAAELDGAGIVRRAWHITLPHMRSVIVLMLTLQIIGAFQVFTEPFVMTGGGPNNSTLTLLMLVFRYAFVMGDFGKATALSILLAVFLTVLAAVFLRATRKWSTS